MVDLPMLDAQLPTQDGGKSLDIKADSLSTIKERLLKLKMLILTLMLNKETSWLVTEELISDNNGKSFTSMNTLSQRKVN
jgi:hypothetical protein